MKYRAIRLETGSFSWGSEVCSRRTKVVDVVYNSSNNELVRTKTLVKGCIVQVDATPFRQWYEERYGIHLGKTKKGEEAKKVKKSKHATKKVARRNKSMEPLPAALTEQFMSGK